MKKYKLWTSLAWMIGIAVAFLLIVGAPGHIGGAQVSTQQLSGNGNLAAEPRADISDDGEYLVAVWIESEESGVYRGDVMLRRGIWDDVQEQYTWSASQTAFAASGGCYLYADVDIQGDIAHVTAAFQTPCNASDDPDFFRIAYRTYDLATMTPSSDQSVISILAPGYVPADVRIAASDVITKPYIAYGRNDGEILYVRWDSTRSQSIGNPNPVSVEEAFKPQIAFTDGAEGKFLHLLWEERTDGTGAPVYRRCSDGAGTCSAPVKLEFEDNVGTYPSPFLDVHGERIIAGWQMCTVNSGSACQKFKMLYARSENAGQSFIDLPADTYPDAALIGSGDAPGPDNEDYAGTDSGVKVYRARLQPSVVLDGAGYPQAAWQIATETATYNRHMITTTYAISDTGTNFWWEQAPGLELTSDTGDYVKPVILPPKAGKIPGGNSTLKGFHLFYMIGNITDNPAYRVEYTYLRETDPNAPTPTPTSESPGEPTPVDEDDDEFIYLPLILR